MSKVPNEAGSSDGSEVLARLGMLRADFGDWSFQHLPATDLPWEAKRRPLAFPPGGGIAWFRAATPERLRELLDAAAQVERRGR